MNGIQKSESGFTLIELLVALAIFSLISVAGVMLLRSGSDTQIAVKKRLEQNALTQRLSNLLEADMAQAMDRPVRDQSGTFLPAFIQSDPATPNMLFGFVRAGWSNYDAAPRAGLQRIAYIFDNGAIKRVTWPMLDGSEASDAATLVENVQTAQAEFRDDAGRWRSDWSATDSKALPRAVALRLMVKGEPEERMLFLVGPQTRVPPPSPDLGGSE